MSSLSTWYGVISLGIAADPERLRSLERAAAVLVTVAVSLAAVLAVAGYAVQSAGDEAVPIARASEPRTGAAGR